MIDSFGSVFMTSQYNVVIFIFKSKCPDRVVEWLPYRRLSFNVNNRKRKPKGQWKLDNSETLAPF